MDLQLTNHQMCDAFTSVWTNKESNPVLEKFTKYAYISDSENDNLSHLIFSTCSKATKNTAKILTNNCFCMCSLK